MLVDFGGQYWNSWKTKDFYGARKNLKISFFKELLLHFNTIIDFKKMNIFLFTKVYYLLTFRRKPEGKPGISSFKKEIFNVSTFKNSVKI